MTRTQPVHSQNQDARIRYWYAKRGFLQDGHLDETEMAALLTIVEEDVFPTDEVLCETAQWTISANLSPDGIRGHRPQRLERQAMARVLPFPAEAQPDSAA